MSVTVTVLAVLIHPNLALWDFATYAKLVAEYGTTVVREHDDLTLDYAKIIVDIKPAPNSALRCSHRQASLLNLRRYDGAHGVRI